METKTGETLRTESIQDLAKRYTDLQITDKIKLLQLLQADVKDERAKLEKNLNIIDNLLGVRIPSRPKPTVTGAGPLKAKKTGATTFKPGPAHQAIVDWIKKHGKAVKKEDVISNKKEVFKGIDAPSENTIKQYMSNLKSNGFLAGGHGEFEAK